jgi:hypothetical protein
MMEQLKNKMEKEELILVETVVLKMMTKARLTMMKMVGMM